MLQTLSTRINRRSKQDRAAFLPHQVAPQSTREFLNRMGIMEEVQKLSIIHVAGTKGKGSTCAFTESILRSAGCRTGLYTSPHLVDIRERIRIDGTPVSEETYLEHFWWTWEKLEAAKTEDLEMPFFFEFMTLLALRIFTQLQVDVILLEVGIGGLKDATNIIEQPAVCGITALGFDHTEILGDTLPQIARQKAGIMKPGVPTITGPQEPDAMATLVENAAEVGCELSVATPLIEFKTPDGAAIQLGLAGDHQRDNASVALQLARNWIVRAASNAPGPAKKLLKVEAQLSSLQLPEEVVAGLANARWPGRAQVVHETEDGEQPLGGGLSFYLDGAHTQESIAQCAKWFASIAGSSSSPSPSSAAECFETELNVMLFYTMPKRDPLEILTPLHETLLQKGCRIDHAMFVPIDSNTESLSASMRPTEIDNSWQRMGEVWETLRAQTTAERQTDAESATLAGGLFPSLPPGAIIVPPRPPLRHSRSTAMPSLGKALEAVRTLSGRQPSSRVRVLVTGSLYLVGDVLKAVKKTLT